jgi:predicted RNA-binding protein
MTYIQGFLPDNAIVEMVTNVNEDISQDNIVKRYNALKCALPDQISIFQNYKIMVDGIYL